MSDEPTVYRQLSDKLSAKGASDACPMCRSERWGLLTESDGASSYDLVIGLQGPRAYILTCLNCGFVRHHVTILVDNGRPRLDEAEGTEK